MFPPNFFCLPPHWQSIRHKNILDTGQTQLSNNISVLHYPHTEFKTQRCTSYWKDTNSMPDKTRIIPNNKKPTGKSYTSGSLSWTDRSRRWWLSVRDSSCNNKLIAAGLSRESNSADLLSASRSNYSSHGFMRAWWQPPLWTREPDELETHLHRS